MFLNSNLPSKKQKSHQKSFIFCFENQAWISKFLCDSTVFRPPLLSLKISVEPLWPRGGVSCVGKYGKKHYKSENILKLPSKCDKTFFDLPHIHSELSWKFRRAVAALWKMKKVKTTIFLYELHKFMFVA